MRTNIYYVQRFVFGWYFMLIHRYLLRIPSDGGVNHQISLLPYFMNDLEKVSAPLL